MKTSLQIRYEVGNEELKEFHYEGKRYRILRVSSNHDLIPEALPMGVWMTGYVRQYLAEADDGTRVEVYVYYYSQRYAVVDAIRKANAYA